MPAFNEEDRVARKVHRCHSCGEKIDIGEGYKRWRWAEGGDHSVNKMHKECYNSHVDAAAACGEYTWEYIPFSYPRGSAE